MQSHCAVMLTTRCCVLAECTIATMRFSVLYRERMMVPQKWISLVEAKIKEFKKCATC